MIFTLIIGLSLFTALILAGGNYNNIKFKNKTKIFLSILVSEIWGIYFLQSAVFTGRESLLILLPLLSISLAYFIYAKIFQNLFHFRYQQNSNIITLFTEKIGKQEAISFAIMWGIIIIILVAIQFNYLTIFIEGIFKISKFHTLLVLSSFIVFYLILGGTRGLIRANILQILFIIMIFPLAITIWINESGSLINNLNTLFQNKNDVFVIHGLLDFIALSLFFLTPFFILTPTHLIRINLIDNDQDITRFYNHIGTFKVLTTFVVFILAGILAYQYENISTLSLIDLMNQSASNLKIILVFSIVFMILGFIDSHIHSASICITNLFDKKYHNYLQCCFLVMTLVIAMTLSYHINYNIIDFVQLISLWACVMGIPLFSCLVNMKNSRIAFWGNFFITISLWLMMQIYIPNAYFIIPVTLMAISLLTFYGVTYCINGRLIFTNSSGGNFSFTIFRFKVKILNYINVQSYNIKKAFYNITHAIQTYKLDHQIFGYLCLIHYTIPYLLWPHNNQHVAIILVLRLIASVMCCVIILHESLPQYLQKRYDLFWLAIVTFCLPFNTMMILLLHNGSIEWILNMLISAMIGLLVLDWLSFLITNFIGISSSIIIYKMFFYNSSPIDNLSFYAIIYMLIFIFFIAIIFARNQQQHMREKIANMKILGGSILHEINTPINHLYMKVSLVKHFVLNKLKIPKAKQNNELIEIIKNLDADVLRMQRITEMLLTALRNAYQPESQDLSKSYSLNRCIESALNGFYLSEEERKKISIKVKPDIKFHGNEHLIENVILNLLTNAFKYAGEKANIKIYNKGKTLFFYDNGKGVSADILPFIFQQFYTRNSRKGTGIGLAFCKIIMEGIGGDIECESKEGVYTKFILHFP